MAQQSGGIRVLHVDDDPEFVDIAAAFLEREDDRLTVESATSVEDALRRLEAGGIDCVVSDYDLPERNGIEFLRTVRETDADLPFVLFTGRGSETVASDAISAGVTDYFRKETGREQYELLANRITDAVSRRRAESNYREIFEKATDGIALHAPETGEFLDVNRRFCEMVGYSRDELVGATVATISPDDSSYTAEEAYERIQRALDGDPQVFDWVAERADGVRVPQEVHLKQTAIGGQDRVLALVRDVTDRAEYERKLTAIHDVADALTRCESVTEVCERTIEASQDVLAFDLSVIDLEDAGRLTKTAISEDMPPTNLSDMSVDEGIAGKTYRTGESMLIRDVANHDYANPQGPYESAVSVPIGDHGVFQAVAESRGAFDESDLELAELLASHTESVLDRLERERELERQNDRLKKLTSVVSHDLRTPLSVAQGRLELTDAGDEHVDAAATAVDRSLALLEDLLALARDGERVNDPEPVAFADAVEESWRNVETGDATLVVESDRTIRADPTRLKQLLENLVRNAVEHAGPDVTVTVRDLPDGFSVADDGPGIPETDRERVFDTGYSTAESGTGFGLNIVDEVAAAHGWTVRATESADGGARFDVTGVDAS